VSFLHHVINRMLSVVMVGTIFMVVVMPGTAFI
jgi:hypothetical protein